MGLRRNKKLKTWLGSQPVRVAGSRPQGPGLQGAWGPGPQGLGPGPPGAWGLFPTKTKNSWSKPGEGVVSAETAASEVGTWRETKPGYPPYPPPHPPPRFGVAREKGRGFSPSPPSATDHIPPIKGTRKVLVG